MDNIGEITNALGIDESQWREFVSGLNSPEVRTHFENGPTEAKAVYDKLLALQPVTAGGN